MSAKNNHVAECIGEIAEMAERGEIIAVAVVVHFAADRVFTDVAWSAPSSIERLLAGVDELRALLVVPEPAE